MNTWQPEGTACAPHWQETVKGHGRLEERALWLFPCLPEMQSYLAQRFGWPGVQWCGWLRRRRTVLCTGSVTESLHVWLAGAAFRWSLTAPTAASLLRGQWTVENKVFYVRDVTMDEDRLHGRRIGYALSGIRNVALSLLRRLGRPYIPDARRHLAARPDLGLPLLL